MKNTEEKPITMNGEQNKLECRACLIEFDADLVYNLFQPWAVPWDGMGSNLAQDLAKIADVEVPEFDLHSKYVCETCYNSLRNASIFASTVRKSDQILKKRIGPDKISKDWPKPIQLETNISENVYDNLMEVEIKKEILSDEDNVSVNNYENIQSNMKTEAPSEDEPIHVTVNGTISNYLFKHNLNGTEYEDEEYLDGVKEEPKSEEEEDDDSVPDLPLECMLCLKSFNSVSGLKAHVIAQHSYKSVKRRNGALPTPEKRKKTEKYVCATCRRPFTTSTDLMVHETCHNKSVCYGCNKSFETFEQLSRHRGKCKALRKKETPKLKSLDDVKRPIKEEEPQADEEVKTPFTCPLCDAEFADAYYMTIHQEVHHTTAHASTEAAPSDSMEIDTLENMFNSSSEK